MRITLTVTEGPHQGLAFEFAKHDTFLVGRSRHAHFQLPTKDRFFSRIHFMIEVNPPQCRLVDMGSHNGTYVNGQKVLAVDLDDGAQIRAGHTILHLSLARDTSETPTLHLGPEALPVATPLALPVALPPDLVPGYFLERLLGKGNMGVVYQARRLSDETFVALKVVRPARPGQPDQNEAFLNDARALMDLDHPSLVRFLDMGQTRGVLFFVSEYVPGGDAQSLLNDVGPLPVPLAVRIITHVLNGIEYGHGRGVIHRDIKPTNIMLAGAEGSETVKLADYGLARVYQSSTLSGLTITRDIAASAPYMPPELITNYREPTLYSDQYAAAATLYMLLTGQPVYDFPTETHLQFSLLLQQQPVPIRRRRPDLSEALGAVVHQALQRNPNQRFKDVAAFREALTEAAAS